MAPIQTNTLYSSNIFSSIGYFDKSLSALKVNSTEITNENIIRTTKLESTNIKTGYISAVDGVFDNLRIRSYTYEKINNYVLSNLFMSNLFIDTYTINNIDASSANVIDLNSTNIHVDSLYSTYISTSNIVTNNLILDVSNEYILKVPNINSEYLYSSNGVLQHAIIKEAYIDSLYSSNLSLTNFNSFNFSTQNSYINKAHITNLSNVKQTSQESVIRLLKSTDIFSNDIVSSNIMSDFIITNNLISDVTTLSNLNCDTANINKITIGQNSITNNYNEISLSTQSIIEFRFQDNTSNYKTTSFIGANGFTQLSDARIKSDLKEINNPLEIIDKLKGYDYFRNDIKKREYGFIAQDVQKVLPSLVNSIDDSLLGIDYQKLIPIMLEAIKSLIHRN